MKRTMQIKTTGPCHAEITLPLQGPWLIFNQHQVPSGFHDMVWPKACLVAGTLNVGLSDALDVKLGMVAYQRGSNGYPEQCLCHFDTSG